MYLAMHKNPQFNNHHLVREKEREREREREDVINLVKGLS